MDLTVLFLPITPIDSNTAYIMMADAGASVMVLTLCDGVVLEHVLERMVDVPEGGPVGRAPLPAAAHQLVHGARAARRALHAVALRQHTYAHYSTTGHYYYIRYNYDCPNYYPINSIMTFLYTYFVRATYT